jgi:hypothetical protein
VIVEKNLQDQAPRLRFAKTLPHHSALNDVRGLFHLLSITPVERKIQSLCQAA